MVLPPIAKSQKRIRGDRALSVKGRADPLWSNALHGGKRDGKSTFDVLEGRLPSGETPLVAKKTNKRTVRREYTKDDVKELRAQFKGKNAGR